MQITDVRVFPVRDEKLRAFVSVVFEGCFMVNDIKVINGRDGYFISMPSRRKKNGDFKDIAHPLNSETRRMLEERILDEYEQVVALDQPAVRRYEEQSPSGNNRPPARKFPAPSQAPAPDRTTVPAPVSAAATEIQAATERPMPTPESTVESSQPQPQATSGNADAVEAVEDRDEDHDLGPGGGDFDSSSQSEPKDLDEVVENHLSDSFWS